VSWRFAARHAQEQKSQRRLFKAWGIRQPAIADYRKEGGEGEKALASINEWPYQGRTGEVAEWSKALPC